MKSFFRTFVLSAVCAVAPSVAHAQVVTPGPSTIVFNEATFRVDEGVGVARVSVRRVGQGTALAGTVSVRVATTTGGTAVSDLDYTPRTTILRWANNEGGLKVFEVPLFNDTVSEPLETVSLKLSEVFGAGVLDDTHNTATLSIVDNDLGPIDTIAPTVTITRPARNAIVRNFEAISGTAGDDGGSGLARVNLVLFRVSDSTYWTGFSWSPIPTSLSTRLQGTAWVRSFGLPNGFNVTGGDYIIVAQAIDRVGNTTRTDRTVTVPMPKPSIFLTLPINGARTSTFGGVSGFVLNAGTSPSVDIYIRRVRDGLYLTSGTSSTWGIATPLPAQVASNGEFQRAEFPALEVGAYTVSVVVTDSRGLKSSVTRGFSIVSGGRS